MVQSYTFLFESTSTKGLRKFDIVRQISWGKDRGFLGVDFKSLGKEVLKFERNLLTLTSRYTEILETGVGETGPGGS